MHDVDSAKKRLESFILEMHRMEVYFGSVLNSNNNILSEDIKNDMKKKIEEIFSVNCTEKERKYGRINNPSISIPPIYGKKESIKKVVEVTKSKIEICTNGDNPFNVEYGYTLVKRKGVWLIDCKEYYDDYDKKWNKMVL